MSISSEISRISGNVADAYTAANAKGATMPVTQNSDNLASTIATIQTGGTPAYQMFSRVKDDNNNDVGIVVGYHIDANGNKYAVVCLNAADRKGGGVQFFDSAVNITSLPTYYGDLDRVIAKETATYNTDALLAYGTANYLTSEAINACRSKSYVIDGTTYYGQVPNTWEMCLIMNSASTINASDPTAATAGPDLIIKIARVWCSNLYSATQICITSTANSGTLSGTSATNIYNLSDWNQVWPVLEIPMQ